MASLTKFQEEVRITYGQFRMNGVVVREAKRAVCQMFAISGQELESIIESREAWNNPSNHSKNYNRVSKILFKEVCNE